MAELVVDIAKIKKAAHNAIPLTITSYTLPHEIEVYVEEVLDVFLSELGQKKLKEYLVYCVKELAVNAKKANTKRVYFQERGLNINDEDEYEAGIKDFKNETLGNINHYLQLQKEKGLYIKISYQARGTNIVLEIRNNVELTKKEYIRIHDKMARSRTYNTLEDALGQIIDMEEGAGLGLIIMVLMLKKMGLSEECFDIWSENKETISRISIPVSTLQIENIALLSDEIVRQISSLPQFPENIVAIQRLISDPKSQIVDIAHQISVDPALTFDLLKMVNSAQFMLSKRVDSITEAVKLVGLRGIKNLLYSYGTQKILGDETHLDKKNLWEHSYRTAFYAYNLAKNFKHSNKSLGDDAYVGGMLHDIGKIVFSTVHPDLLEHIKTFSINKNIPSRVFEDLSAGLNHSEIGARIAEKWNFPEPLVASIRFHHEPNLATDYKDVIYTVYLANMFCEIESGNITFEQLESGPLLEYGISSEQQLLKLVEQFSEGFLRESAKKEHENIDIK